MVWIISLTFFIISILFLGTLNYRKKVMKEKVAQTLQKGNEWPHSDAAVWEENLRAELAKTQIMLDRGEISDEEYLIQSEFLLERYREIERKYHSSDTEVIYDYQDYSNFPYYDYR